jgi:signal transduction histidine kinase
MLQGAAAFASDHGTPEEAKAMALRAAEFLKANGEEKAFAAFNDKSQFHDRDLYVFVQDDKGVVKAHGGNPNLIGKDLSPVKDLDGKLFVQEINATKSEGWVDYKWQNAQTKAVEPKTSYVVRVDHLLVGVGAYKK